MYSLEQKKKQMKEEKRQNSIIEIRCRKCNKLIMKYFVCGDDSFVALQNVGIKCDRCKRVMILKKCSEGLIKNHLDNGSFKI